MRQAYIIYDSLGNIWQTGFADQTCMPTSNLSVLLISFEEKLQLDSSNPSNCFVSTTTQAGFNLLFQKDTLFIYEKQKVMLSVSKKVFDAGGEDSTTIIHNADEPIRIWRDLHQPLVAKGAGGLADKNGIVISASIPGTYKIRIRHPRYYADPVLIRAKVPDNG